MPAALAPSPPAESEWTPARVATPAFDPDDGPFGLTIPASAHTLDGFREWTSGGEVPEKQKVTFIRGRIWIDMTNERIKSHTDVKTCLVSFLKRQFDDRDLGKVWTDGVTLVNEAAGLSSGPDVTACLWTSFDEGRVALGTPVREAGDDSVELVGSPDIACEVLSTASVRKDTQELPETYFAAGVAEYWLLDARGGDPSLRLLVRGDAAFEPAAESEGWQTSGVLEAAVRMTTRRQRHGFVDYRFETR